MQKYETILNFIILQLLMITAMSMADNIEKTGKNLWLG